MGEGFGGERVEERGVRNYRHYGISCVNGAGTFLEQNRILTPGCTTRYARRHCEEVNNGRLQGSTETYPLEPSLVNGNVTMCGESVIGHSTRCSRWETPFKWLPDRASQDRFSQLWAPPDSVKRKALIEIDSRAPGPGPSASSCRRLLCALS